MIAFANEKGQGAANTKALGNQNPQQDITQTGDRLQVVADRMDAFRRLQERFSVCGWSLHPLHDDSMLAVHRRWQMSHVCHSSREAHALLRRIGGGA